MLKFFRLPFAVSGDKTAVPDAVDVNGNVSYTQGYGFDYQRQKTDPAAKNIERDKMNQVLFDMTNAVAELQAQGVPDFITSALNGGTAYSYGAMAVVRWTDNDLYFSLAAANTATPADATKWAKVPTAARIQQQAFTAAVATGTVDALVVAFTPAFASWAGQAFWARLTGANVTTTPTIAADGLAALTIVKGNNLPLAPADLPGAGAWAQFKHDATLGKVVLLNPATGITNAAASIQGAFKNLTASASGVSADISVTADEIAVESASNTYQTLRNVALTLAGTSVGANGLDAGTIAASTWYSLWVIWNGSTVAGLISLSATSPTLPGGYTHKARVGWVRTDSSGNKYPLSFKQYGDRVQYVVSAGGNLTGLPIITSGISGNTTIPTWGPFAVGNFVPSTASRIQLSLYNNGQTSMVAPNNSYGGVNSATNAPPLISAFPSPGSIFGDIVLESSNIYAAGNANSVTYVMGWNDNL